MSYLSYGTLTVSTNGGIPNAMESLLQVPWAYPLLGRPLTDPELNSRIFQGEGKTVELFYTGTFNDLLGIGGKDSTMGASGAIHKYIRTLVLTHFGTERLKAGLFTQIGNMVDHTLRKWSTLPAVEVKMASSNAIFQFTAKHETGCDQEKLPKNFWEKFRNISQSFMSIPIRIPGTKYYRCAKDKEEVLNILKGIMEEKRSSPETRGGGDVFDHAIADLNTQSFITEDFAILLIFVTTFVSFDSVSSVLPILFKCLAENPSASKELEAEHEALLKRRKENHNSPLSWDEYKSLTFTPHDIDARVTSKNFMPFGGGGRQCAGAEFAKAFLASFIHAIFNFTTKHVTGCDEEKLPNNFWEKFKNIYHSFMSIPIRIPGTSYYRCVKDKEEVLNILKGIMEEKCSSPETRGGGDAFDHAIADLNTQSFITEDFVLLLMWAFTFASFESLSRVLPILFKCLGENSSASMELEVVNEILRLASPSPGILRRALVDINVKGYTIPAGWMIMPITQAYHLNPDVYKDPLVFNPWRWEDIEARVTSKNFMPFGGGARQCAGAEFSKAFLASFIHRPLSYSFLATPLTFTLSSRKESQADPELNNRIFHGEGKMVELFYTETMNDLLGIGGKDSTMGASGAIHKYIRTLALTHYGTERLKAGLFTEIGNMVDHTLSIWSTLPAVEDKEEALNILKGMMEEKCSSPETQGGGDVFDHAIADLNTQSFLTEDFVVLLIYGFTFASFDSVSTILPILFKCLAENPSASKELEAQHEALLERRRENHNSPLSWDEYKSLTFTPHDIEARVVSKNFMPFGGGIRQCAGAEWRKIMGGKFYRNPMLSFGDGIHIKFIEKKHD
ncbi:hypothetical protein Tsubulata_032195 [Turnera subulata]|uniref:Cytochrome P450 n=1 Tax=Turnera subulata TaxID=218843 RepID=A0A9Q0EZJ7_9ROSI|nr:hypothetical protein Tsubulata_032195 [Turnera subulata]